MLGGAGFGDAGAEVVEVVGVAHAGSCWVRQWRVPRPQTRSTEWMPTTWRVGKQEAMMLRARRSLAVVEGGDEDERVGDVEVGVAGGEALALEDDGRGHGQARRCWKGLPWLEAGGVAEGVEAVEVLGQREMVLVGGVGLDAGEDGVLARRSGRRRRCGRGCRRRRSRGAARGSGGCRGNRGRRFRAGAAWLLRRRGRGCAAGPRRASTPRW